MPNPKFMSLVTVLARPTCAGLTLVEPLSPPRAPSEGLGLIATRSLFHRKSQSSPSVEYGRWWFLETDRVSIHLSSWWLIAPCLKSYACRFQLPKLIKRVRFPSPAPLFSRHVAVFSLYRIPLGVVLGDVWLNQSQATEKPDPYRRIGANPKICGGSKKSNISNILSENQRQPA